MQVIVVGLASGKEWALHFDENQLNTNLLNLLRSKSITVASSCDGEGVCKKCVIQNDWLTCKMTLKEFLQRQRDGKIYLSYL